MAPVKLHDRDWHFFSLKFLQTFSEGKGNTHVFHLNIIWSDRQICTCVLQDYIGECYIVVEEIS